METQRYPTDLSDAEWALVAPHIPAAWRGGRPRTVDAREVVNAVRYVVRYSVAWRALPTDFPHFRTVYYHYRQWIRLGVWDQILDALRAQDRVRAGRKPDPTAMVIDSQTVKVGSRGGSGATTAASSSLGANA